MRGFSVPEFLCLVLCGNVAFAYSSEVVVCMGQVTLKLDTNICTGGFTFIEPKILDCLCFTNGFAALTKNSETVVAGFKLSKHCISKAYLLQNPILQVRSVVPRTNSPTGNGIYEFPRRDIVMRPAKLTQSIWNGIGTCFEEVSSSELDDQEVEANYGDQDDQDDQKHYKRAVSGGSCSAEQFSCVNGNCINDKSRCDNKNDCGDNSDERECGRPKPEAGSSCVPEECELGGYCLKYWWCETQESRTDFKRTGIWKCNKCDDEPSEDGLFWDPYHNKGSCNYWNNLRPSTKAMYNADVKCIPRCITRADGECSSTYFSFDPKVNNGTEVKLACPQNSKGEKLVWDQETQSCHRCNEVVVNGKACC